MKKNLFLTALLTLCILPTFAQEKTEEEKPSLFEQLFKRKNKKDWISIVMHTKASLDLESMNHTFQKGTFSADQLRIDIRGEVLPNLTYRYQQRLTNVPSMNEGTADNFAASIDYAILTYQFNPHFRIQAGKMCVAYGGFEIDANPIDIYQYSNMVMHSIGFLTGVDFGFYINPDQEFRLQILNGRADSYANTYGILPEHITPAKMDMVYTLNWNGKMGKNKQFLTRWSASYLNQAKGKHTYMASLGTAYKGKKWGTYLDLMYSNEDIDRKRIVSNLVREQSGGQNLMNTTYFTAVHHLNLRVHPQWNLFVKNSYDRASLGHDTQWLNKGVIQEIWSYGGGVEYYPFKKLDLHFNVAYTGRKYFNNNQVKSMGADPGKPTGLEFSIIWAMKVL